MAVALAVLGDWCEDNLTAGVAQWVRGGMGGRFEDYDGLFWKAPIPLLWDALKEAGRASPSLGSYGPEDSYTPALRCFVVVCTGGIYSARTWQMERRYSTNAVLYGPVRSSRLAHLALRCLDRACQEGVRLICD